jgi:Cu/Ag efflux protein CusF
MVRFSTFFIHLAALIAITAASGTASAQTHDHGHAQPRQGSPAAPESGTISTGEVQEVNKQDGTLTIQHGPLTNLNMPGMTMVFKVADPAMLSEVKAGDKIRFRADDVNGELTVTRLESAR